MQFLILNKTCKSTLQHPITSILTLPSSRVSRTRDLATDVLNRKSTRATSPRSILDCVERDLLQFNSSVARIQVRGTRELGKVKIDVMACCSVALEMILECLLNGVVGFRLYVDGAIEGRGSIYIGLGIESRISLDQ